MRCTQEEVVVDRNHNIWYTEKYVVMMGRVDRQVGFRERPVGARARRPSVEYSPEPVGGTE